MNGTTRFEMNTNGSTIGTAVGVLVGVLGILYSIIVLFLPIWSIGAVAGGGAGIEYLLGNYNAVSLFSAAIFALLVSFLIIHTVINRAIRLLWLITGIIGISALGSLEYPGNTGKFLLIVTILLAISAALLTISPNPDL